MTYEALLRLVEQVKGTSHLAESSMFRSKVDFIENERIKQSLVVRLQREQGQYSVALLNIMDVAQRINRNAQLRTESDANRANWEIAGGVLIAVFLVMVIGLYFRRAVATPLEVLTHNIGKVAISGDGDGRFIDDKLLLRRDEIGDLAKQFAQSFEALATARRELQEASRAEISLQRDRLHGAIENMPQGLYMLDRDGRIIVANRRLQELYNLGTDIDLLGMSVDAFIGLCREKGAGVKRTLSNQIISDVNAHGGYQTSQRLTELDDGRVVTVTVMRLPDGGYVVTHEDITERKRSEEQITHLAHYDALTDLPNRALFHERLKEELVNVPLGQRLALHYIDIDEFKGVNDSLGHLIGDELLKSVAASLSACVGKAGFVARLGGDEFAVVQTAIRNREDVEQLIEDILTAIRAPRDCLGHQLTADASIGVAMIPEHGTNLDQIMKNADLAMYAAKAAGRRTWRFFEPEMDAQVKARHQLEVDLRQAILDDQLEVYYQPFLSLQDDRIVGCEALVRWKHPTRGNVSPAEFIPIAEDTGLIHQLGERVLHVACTEAATWPDDIRLAVNVSPVQFKSGTLALKVANTLATSGLSPHRLELEITEAVLIRDDDALDTLHQLRALGVRIALDDFGTGYSSLSYLQRIPFDKIKIDRCFVKDITESEGSAAIVQAVVNIAAIRKMSTTAEGVETEAQRQALKRLGCSEMQGYLFSPPRPAAEVRALFAAHRADGRTASSFGRGPRSDAA